MSKTFDQGKDEVATLCQYFATNRQSFHAHGVKEDHVRQSLINPFFVALGWDVHNVSMTAPQYREVIPEDSLDVEGHQKAPDYTFRVGTLPKFYVEAKKCGVNISTDPAPAYQLRRYGFSAKLALSILTDFDELAVYDCASRPRPTDKASHARIQYLGFKEYTDRWREIWDVFSREAVWSGSFDQYAASKRKRGTSEVDSEFLKDIEGWRDVLARNLALRNNDLSADDLNAAVQRIIDRIIFLRMAEDRGLEPDGQLLKLCEQPDIYDRFMKGLCRRADEKYNSGLFHFQKESGVFDAPDTLTPRLTVDDKTIKPILQSLYFEHGCPYHFGVMPVEILGTVYERFLGKVIRLTAGHQAKVEEKPEVRKAGGVYYTPAYIVNYIVHNTIGKQIEGKSPADLAGGKTTPPFRVLDMACGSGSFLLGAYQFLLDHCLKWYQTNPSPKHAKAIYQNAKGEPCLTIAERKRILTTHICGVDIDRQAVETTKLSLLLKALEGENDASLSQQMSLFHERALPNLSHNIKCGNSLIASDFSMDPEDLIRVHAFDWPAQFPDAMKAGGFDAVIGNPPYGFHQIHTENVKPYFKQHFAAAQGSFEHYFLFYEKSLGLLRKGGLHGFITPVTWLTIPSAHSLRKYILENYSLKEIVWLPELVFANAQVNTLVSTIASFPAGAGVTVKIYDKLGFVQPPKERRDYKQQSFIDSDYLIGIFETQSDGNILKKILSLSTSLSGFARPCSGYNPYEVGKGQDPNGELQTAITVRTKPYHSERKLGKEWKPEIVGRDLSRYSVIVTGKRWIKYGPWLAAARDPNNFVGKRILIQEITGGKDRRLTAGFYEGELYHSRDVIPVKIENDFPHAFYLLGIINSKLITWYHHRKNPKAQKGLFPKVLVSDLSKLPIRTINFADAVDKTLHDKLVALVDKMLALTPKLYEATSESEKAALQNAVTTTDVEIDRFVYELYGLTEEEIRIVEGQN